MNVICQMKSTVIVRYLFICENFSILLHLIVSSVDFTPVMIRKWKEHSKNEHFQIKFY